MTVALHESLGVLEVDVAIVFDGYLIALLAVRQGPTAIS